MDAKVTEQAGAELHAGRWRSYLSDCAAVADAGQANDPAGADRLD